MKTLICIPAMNTVRTGFLTSLIGLRRPNESAIATTEGTLVHTARHHLAKTAVEGGFDRMLWLDSDMMFGPDLMERLSADLDEGREMVCGIYFTRILPVRPTIYKALNYDGEHGDPETYRDYPQDSIFEIAGCGFGAVMMTVEAYKKVLDASVNGHPFTPLPGLGEDLSFCLQAGYQDIKMWCDSRIKCGHIGQYTFSESDYVRD